MDINPYNFTAPYEKFEFANFCKSENVELVVLLSNWILSLKGDQKSINKAKSNERESILSGINYWLDRLTPLLPIKENETSSNKIYFAVSNRIGTENKTTFNGTSCIVQVQNEVKLLSNLGVFSEGVIEKTLYWKK